MCGLAGLLDRGGASQEALTEIVSTMGRVLTHRGPDGSGVWCDAAAGVGLAHQRLAIIDLSEQGHQPMVSADGRYILVFNGEIYNYPELARRLASDGVRLRGHSDTEVLLETVARHSISIALEAANGMFALALWDRHDRTLTLARDRLGEKPLYYTSLGREFIFASELTALRRHPRFSATVSRGAVALLMRHSYVPGPHSIYEGVHKLPPGHTLTLRLDERFEAAPQPFWSLRQVAQSGRAQVTEEPDQDIVDSAEELLRDSVRMRMVSDVPLGAFLSGGIDSSLIVALMQTVSDRPVRTFTVSVGGQYDESGHAAAVARHLGTDHAEIHLPETDALTLASQVAGLYDEPFGDPSALPTALVAAAARQHVTVCLTGDGGDEVMAGYNRYLAADRALARVTRLPDPLRGGLGAVLRGVSPRRWDQLGRVLPNSHSIPDLGTKMHKLAGLIGAPDGHAAYRSLTTNVEPAQVMFNAVEPDTVATDPDSWPIGADPLHLMLYLDGAMTLPDDMLVKVDRASMAVSLECRVPMLDHRFVELAWRLPRAAKLRGREGKWVLRQILRRHLPNELFDRPKRGFDPPLAGWLRGPLRPWVGDLLGEARLREQQVFDPSGVQRLVREHWSGERNHDYALWTLLMFQSWLEGQSASDPAMT